MGNGIESLIKKHYEDSEEGSFESLMCAFALEMLEVKRNRWKWSLFIVSMWLVPIIVVILDKVL